MFDRIKAFKKEIPKKYFLSLVSPVKNEHDYLIPYVKFYAYHGVEHFFFYDNGSTIPVKETLKDYLDICTITDFPGIGVQYPIYDHFLKNFGKTTEWVAVFDIDEFVLPKKHETLAGFLKDYTSFDAVAINWVTFGNGHHKKKQEGPLIKNYLYSSGVQHPNFKSIYKTGSVSEIKHSHHAKLKRFKKYVDPLYQKITSDRNLRPTLDVIQLNHYFTKSEEEYLKKIHSKRPDTGKSYYDHTEDRHWLMDEHIRTSEVFTTEIWDKYKHIFEE